MAGNETGANKQAEERYYEMLATAPDAILTTDGLGRILFLNTQAEKMFGYTRDELLLQSVDILVPERFRGRHVGDRKDYYAQPRTRPMNSGLNSVGRRKDGTEFPVEISLSPLKTGEGTLVTTIIRDISERKKVEEDLKDARAFTESLIQTAGVMIVLLDSKGCVTRYNQTAEKITGYTEAELRGKNWFEILVPKKNYPYVWEEFNRLLSAGSPKTFENPILTKSGEERHIMWQNNVVKMGGHIAGTISYGNDITERKRMEEALRESERRLSELAREQERQLILSERLISFGELTASLAHEFNNPLGIVIGFAQDLLTEVDPSDPRHQSVKIIEEEARRCKKIMQNLLDFGRQSLPQYTQTEPLEMIQKNIALLSTRFHKAKIKTVIQVPNRLPKIWVDQQQVGQVLVNLFLNAVEAMPEGGTLTIGLTVQPDRGGAGLNEPPDPGGEVVLSVSDTGQGIEPDHLSKIFLPFFTTKSKMGMGLGLSICKSIMEAHGGKISAGSIPGRGTVFSLYLPVDRRRRHRDESVVT
jgi:PAS domain S-box-containing protein